MALVTLNVGDRFPAGTAVSAYLRSDLPAMPTVPSGVPSGPVAVSTANVAADGTLALPGLADETKYVAYAQVGGRNLYVQFATKSVKPFTNDLNLAEERSITLRSNRPAGTVSQLLRMVMTTANDRPWISWIDHLGRHRCTLGYHDFDVTDAAVHQRYEIKTSMDPAGATPAGLRTRFAVGTDADRTAAIFNGLTDLELNPGQFVDNTAFGIVLKERDRANAATVTLASFRALIDAADNTFIDIDGAVSVVNKNATLRFFRNLNTGTSTASIAVKKGDGTNTDALTFNAKTGSLAIAGTVGFNGTAAPAKPAVVGSRAANAALASLLTALASTGLLTDSSTV